MVLINFIDFALGNLRISYLLWWTEAYIYDIYNRLMSMVMLINIIAV